MPIYEYRCTRCGREWSRQEPISEHGREPAACPVCGADSERVFSAFFAKTVRKS
ncbi:MAG TPA: zinc ribbon domain-containing protein [Gemmatimonadales bacterium]